MSGRREAVADAQTPLLNSSSRFSSGVFAAVLFVLPLLLIFLLVVPAAGVFIEKLPSILRDKCIRLVLVVACFFAAAFVSNAIRFSNGRVGVFTAGLVLLFLVHFVLAIWGGAYPDIQYQFGQGAPMLQYLWMLGSMFYGMVTWSIVQRKVEPRKELLKDAKPQFTIGSILVWVTLTALMIALLRSWAFQFLLEAGADPNASIDVVVCAICCAALLLPLTIWLMRTRRFLLVALGCWIICFMTCWIVFALIGLRDSSYDLRDGYVSTIVAFALASALALFWFLAIRLILNYRPEERIAESNAPRLVSRLAISGFTILSVSLWGFVAFWAIANFGTFSKERSFAAFDSSPLIMQQLEEAYGAEAMERVRDRYDPKKLHEWLNGLSRDRVPKERDLIYQLAKLTKLEYVDHPEGEGLYRKMMGFSKEEVAQLSDETLSAWIRENRVDPKNEEYLSYEGDVSRHLTRISNDEFGWLMSHSPWNQDSVPLAAKFCREKSELIQRIRDLIRRCDAGTFPEFEHGLFLSDDFSRFAAEMLFVDTRYAIAQDELPRVFDNLECISKFSALDYPLNNWSFLPKRLRAQAMNVLLHLTEVKPLGQTEVVRIKEIAAKLNSPVSESKILKARGFAKIMLEHRAYMDSKEGENYLLLDWELESRLIAAFPQTVDWASYIEAYKGRFDHYSALRNEIHTNPSKIAEICQIATSESNLEQSFYRHVLNLFETPGARARRLGSLDYEYELSILNICISGAVGLFNSRSIGASLSEKTDQVAIMQTRKIMLNGIMKTTISKPPPVMPRVAVLLCGLPPL